MKNSPLLLFCFLLFMISCSSSKKDKEDMVQTHELVLENIVDHSVDTTTKISPESKLLNCILINSDSIYCYPGNKLKEGSFYAITRKNSFRIYIKEYKKRTGDSLVVFLKPTSQCSYKTTVDILDEMTINQIPKYSMVKVNKKEESFLGINDFNWESPEPVAIQTPSFEDEPSIPEKGAFLVELRRDSTVWYTILSEDPSDTIYNRVYPPVTSTLKKVIAVYEKKNPGTKKQYLIKGDKDVSYKIFEQVTEALKQNNIYKYNLVTRE